jgi:WXXGXW repeat (2 copies)
MRKFLGAALFASALAVGTARAQAPVRIGPPPPVVERYGAAPHPGWVWRGGYYRWNGRGYAWAPGYWVRPPRPHAVWVPARWGQRPGGWVFVQGHWRY